MTDLGGFYVTHVECVDGVRRRRFARYPPGGDGPAMEVLYEVVRGGATACLLVARGGCPLSVRGDVSARVRGEELTFWGVTNRSVDEAALVAAYGDRRAEDVLSRLEALLPDAARVYVDLRDWWVGYYRGEDHHYICPLPTIVIRWPRRRAVRHVYFSRSDLTWVSKTIQGVQ